MAVQQVSEETNPRYKVLASLLREEDGIVMLRARYPRWNVNEAVPCARAHSYDAPYFSTACRKGDIPVAQALLELGADATARNHSERNALMLVCGHGGSRGGRVKMVTWLLQCVTEVHASIDEESRWGNTALHVAAANGNAAIVRVLLRFGANHTKRNKEGYTAAELARARKEEESAVLIETFAQITEIGEWRPWKASEFPPDFRRALHCLVVISKSGTNLLK